MPIQLFSQDVHLLFYVFIVCPSILPSLRPMLVIYNVGEPVKREVLKGKIVPRHPHVWLWSAKERTTELLSLCAHCRAWNVSRVGHVANQTVV